MYHFVIQSADAPSQQGFRSASTYDLPPATDKEKKENKKYIHVLDEL